MGTNYVVPTASPFLINGVSSLTPGPNISLDKGTGDVTIVDLAGAINYVSTINGLGGDVQFDGSNNLVVFTQTPPLNGLIISPFVKEIIPGGGGTAISVFNNIYTINFN